MTVNDFIKWLDKIPEEDRERQLYYVDFPCDGPDRWEIKDDAIIIL